MRRIFTALSLLFLAAAPCLAWEDCPFGLVNDPHPGKCGLYEDTNHDSLCDHSQKNPALLARAQDTAVPYVTGTVKSAGQAKPRSSRTDRTAGNTLPAPVPHSTTARIAPDMPALAPAPRPPSPLRQRYPLWQVFLAVFLLAVVTEVLIKRDKRLTLPLQAAWNWALALSFLLTFASGLVYVYPALLARINFNMSYWHSLAGLVMIAAGLYHFARRSGSMWRGLSVRSRATGPEGR
jgi:hypothetical protein